MATSPAPRIYRNFINGEWVESRSGKAYENRNPANTDELVGMFVSSTSEDVDAAVESAKQAYKKWRLVPAPKRAEILYRAAEAMVAHKEDFSKDMTREMGKVLAETRGDVQEAIDMTYYMAGEGRRLFGQTTPSELPNKFAMSVRQSIGVAGIDHAVEFSDGDSVVEDDAGAGERKHRCIEAGGGYAALFVSPCADACGRGFAAGRRELG